MADDTETNLNFSRGSQLPNYLVRSSKPRWTPWLTNFLSFYLETITASVFTAFYYSVIRGGHSTIPTYKLGICPRVDTVLTHPRKELERRKLGNKGKKGKDKGRGENNYFRLFLNFFFVFDLSLKKGKRGRIREEGKSGSTDSNSFSKRSARTHRLKPVLTNMDISTGHMVLTYMEDHLRNKDRLDQEWQALCAYEAEPSTSTLAASKPENGSKNRFQDVLPYDHSRVILNTLGNEEGSDYINASAIADHDPRHPAYIAAQAPLPGTVVDFWQMIWEQGSVVLVLLTKTSENGQELCHVYWPQEGSQRYNYFEVHLVSEHIWCDDYLVRSFYLKNLRTGETRTVTQFHFLSWPENSVPLSTKALLEFRRKVNKSYRGRSCPIVVHCSDGAGRTGTYCLIDMVLHRMAKGAREIDIAATLEHLRDQRAKAVRTKQQFEFVLTAVAEEVHAILRALPQ
nr:EOG090X01LO [Eulimnadia texana]